MLPKRVQRSRTKTPGIPEGAVYVGRPTQWGNQFKVGNWTYPKRNSVLYANGQPVQIATGKIAVVAFYEDCISRAKEDPYKFAAWLRPLFNKSLCCWCSTADPCHADVLTHFANSLFTVTEDGYIEIKEAFFVAREWPTLEEIFWEGFY